MPRPHRLRDPNAEAQRAPAGYVLNPDRISNKRKIDLSHLDHRDVLRGDYDGYNVPKSHYTNSMARATVSKAKDLELRNSITKDVKASARAIRDKFRQDTVRRVREGDETLPEHVLYIGTHGSATAAGKDVVMKKKKRPVLHATPTPRNRADLSSSNWGSLSMREQHGIMAESHRGRQQNRERATRATSVLPSIDKLPRNRRRIPSPEATYPLPKPIEDSAWRNEASTARRVAARQRDRARGSMHTALSHPHHDSDEGEHPLQTYRREKPLPKDMRAYTPPNLQVGGRFGGDPPPQRVRQPIMSERGLRPTREWRQEVSANVTTRRALRQRMVHGTKPTEYIVRNDSPEFDHPGARQPSIDTLREAAKESKFAYRKGRDRARQSEVSKLMGLTGYARQ